MTDNIISTPTLEWNEQGQPISTAFDDVYFSTDNGLDETRYIFLQHNLLAQRWQTLNQNPTSQIPTNQSPTNKPCHFVIGETGFGTGLNFLAAWELWLDNAPTDARLHFISVEKYPLKKAELQQALKLWPELSPLSEQLIEAYPTITSQGFHRLCFDNHRVTLTLIIDDASAGLEQLLASQHPLFEYTPTIDAWFLDGFTPAKNPEMWTEALIKNVGKLSHAHTTLATFAAASDVRRRLESVGFQVKKASGYGKKREMMYAQFEPPQSQLKPEDFPSNSFNSLYPTPWAVNNNPPAKHMRAIIIGAGLAGCHTARALAERHWQVTLIEQHDSIATQGSGNPQGVLYAKLSPKREANAEFNLASLLFSQRFYQEFWQEGKDMGQACGVLQQAYSDKEKAFQESFKALYSEHPEFVQFVDAETASALANIDVPTSGLFFPNAGWLNPAKVCQRLIDHPNIQLVTNSPVSNLYFEDQHWHAHKNDGANDSAIASAEVAIITCAQHARRFEQSQHLPLRSIRGQVSYPPATEASQALKTVICGKGYIAPSINERHCLGATFNLNDDETQLRPQDHQHNLEQLRDNTPALAQALGDVDCESLDGRVGFRCTTLDYLPLVGPVPKDDAFLDDYALLRKNAKANIHTAGHYWPQLYVNVGHGSRGLAYTPLCAELLAAQICGEPSPVGRDLQTALNPARFIIRDLVRKKR